MAGPVTLEELARHLGGRLEGDGRVEVVRVASPESCGPGAVCVCASAQALQVAAERKAAAVVVPEGLACNLPAVRVTDPRRALAALLELLGPRPHHPQGVHPAAVVHPTARLGPQVAVGAFAVVEEGATVGARTVLYPFAYVGPHASVGDDCVLYPHVVVGERVQVGNRVVLHAGCVLGSDGFGFVPGPPHHKIPQVGTVVVEDDVEIGAGTTVDRATLDATRIGAGTKIDNLVQVAHNVQIGRGCLIAAQCGIAGSAVLEDGVVLAGQVGVGDHVRIGRGAVVLAQSGVTKDVPAGATVYGHPAQPRQDELREQAARRQLPRLLERIRRLERLVAKEEDAGKGVG
ncbi:MAG: UDP-3-O-(3-hydroxymyristoyl)glucosamine N-acyltransferase [Armatimonadota bacterium]|nr:UDP-3-O-(3-hydroxymyristoyl)glucosamine N-acyltransferase [Armatimonadota bacterium]MDW8156029.1 UDP-3-O-(3-hydroxymyristoyl)glucosamine N-acyltransferase [Armatimonadota bacterium]